MPNLWIQIAGLLTGTLVSLIVTTTILTRNRSKFRCREIALKATPGFIKFFVLHLFSSGISYFILLFVDTFKLLPSPTSNMITAFILPATLAVLLPHSPHLDRSTSVPESWFFASLFKFLQVLREINNFLQIVYDEKEIDVSRAWFDHPSSRKSKAIDQFFDLHSPHIARKAYRDLPEEEKEEALNLPKTKNQHVRFKFLIRHFGFYKACEKLKEIEENPLPSTTLPSNPGGRWYKTQQGKNYIKGKAQSPY